MTRARRPPPPGAARSGLGGEQVEGRRAVNELLAARRRRVRALTVAAQSAGGLGALLALAAAREVPVRHVPQAELRALARTEAPQGVVASAEPVAPAEVGALIGRPDAFLVALDGVTDPGNLGAILRVAETAGATGVVLPRHRAARLTPAAVKAAAGAIEHLPIASVAGVPGFLERARRAGLWTVGLDAAGEAELLDLPVAARRLVLVVGAEGTGLSRLTRARCEVLARISVGGRLASLNVAAAAAVACFEIARHRGGSVAVAPE